MKIYETIVINIEMDLNNINIIINNNIISDFIISNNDLIEDFIY